MKSTAGKFPAVLQWLNVLCGRTFLPLRHLKLDLLALGQRFEATPHYCGVMHEHILTTIFRADKTETFIVVKPLYGACNHKNTSIEKNCYVLQFILVKRCCGRGLLRKYRRATELLQEVRCSEAYYIQFRNEFHNIFQ
ncbi:MAG: hypothetical protein MAG794_00936 [Gammaproteobacteria bacterium]|nr:hypothetical protein [Gammaproteobacteria bacterium]